MYQSPSELIGEALHLLEHRDAQMEIEKKALMKDLRVGIDQLNQGHGKSIDFQDLKANAKRQWEESKS